MRALTIEDEVLNYRKNVDGKGLIGEQIRSVYLSRMIIGAEKSIHMSSVIKISLKSD